MCSHPFLAPDEGPTAGPGPSQSRTEYVSVLNLFVFCYVLLTLFFLLFFSISQLARLPPLAQMNPRERHALELYLNDCKDLFAEWQAFKGHGPS